MSFDISGIGAIADLVGKFIPDKTQGEKDAFAWQIAQLQAQQQQLQMQADTNKAEASNASPFVAGWRPFIGWVCGSGLAYQFIVAPLATWMATLAGHPVAMPPLDMGTLITLLFGMLGLGGMRTFEKTKGVQANH